MREKKDKRSIRAVSVVGARVASCAGTQPHDRAGWRGVGGLGGRGSGDRSARRLG